MSVYDYSTSRGSIDENPQKTNSPFEKSVLALLDEMYDENGKLKHDENGKLKHDEIALNKDQQQDKKKEKIADLKRKKN